MIKYRGPNPGHACHPLVRRECTTRTAKLSNATGGLMQSVAIIGRLLVLIALAVAGAAHAQNWPSKPIRWLVGFAPGGGTDIVARALAVKVGEQLGQGVIVENRAGAAGTIAADLVAKAPSDGYTFL